MRKFLSRIILEKENNEHFSADLTTETQNGGPTSTLQRPVS